MLLLGYKVGWMALGTGCSSDVGPQATFSSQGCTGTSLVVPNMETGIKDHPFADGLDCR